MISDPKHTFVILGSGVTLSAAEVYEALVLLARNQSSFPLLTRRDETQSVISTALDAQEWVEGESK